MEPMHPNCAEGGHILHYHGKHLKKDKSEPQKYMSRCERCREVLITSVPIGQGVPLEARL